MAKLGKKEHVSHEVLVRICKVLRCDIGDVFKVIEGDQL